MIPNNPRANRASANRLLIFAAWAGLVCGLVEGAGLLGLQRLGWLNWNMAQVAVSMEIIWIAALLDLLLFLIVGLLVAGVVRLFPSLMPVGMGALAFLLLFDWLALSGRIRHFGALMLGLGLAVMFARWYAAHAEAAHRCWRRSLPWVAALALLCAAGIEGGKWWMERRALAALPTAASGAPNVLVIIVDTLRADHLSAYGYERATSPRIDAVAREGVLFEAAIATSSWTLPSHVALVTGRYPYENHPERGALDPAAPTVAEVFRDRGYRTAAFSANTFFFSSHIGFGRGFLRFEDFFHSWADRAARTLYGRKIAQYVLRRLGYEDIPGRKLAADVTDAALRWMGSDQRPFLAYLNYFDAHDPYLPPQPWRNKFSARPNPGGILNSFLLRYYPEMSAEQLQDEIAAYDGAIAYVDDQIGRLLDELDRRGLAHNTIVVITSDHGEMLGEHGLHLHRNCLYREAIHVPLIVRWPGGVPAGLRVAQPVSIASIPATVAELAGAKAELLLPGPSLAALWQPGTPPAGWPDPLAELEKFPFEPVKNEPAYHGVMKSLVSSDWHYIEHEKFGQELFHWRNDPAQATNLAAAPDEKPVVDGLANQLKQRLARPRTAAYNRE
jgi:arylsulfatase A-like enzyme